MAQYKIFNLQIFMWWFKTWYLSINKDRYILATFQDAQQAHSMYTMLSNNQAK